MEKITGSEIGQKIRTQNIPSFIMSSKCAPYQDHANREELDSEKLPVKTKGGVYIPFPEKLFNMLHYIDIHEHDLSNVISWQSHGRCFRVHDIQRFESMVLPRFFSHQKNASFLRQLNLWNFKRINENPRDRGAYYNEFFLRSKKFLHRNIYRRGGKKKRPTHPSSPSTSDSQSSSDDTSEPKFHAMKAMPPSSSVNAVNPVEGPRKELPEDSCAHASLSHPDFDEANWCCKAPVLPSIAEFASFGRNMRLLPRNDAKKPTGASRSARTPAESIALNGRAKGDSRVCPSSRPFFDQDAANSCYTTDTLIFLRCFGNHVTSGTYEDDRSEQHASRKLPLSSSGGANALSVPAARITAASRTAHVDELNNITPDTTLYHHQSHNQQHLSEEAMLEQHRRTVSSITSNASLLLLGMNKEQSYDRYVGLMPLPNDFPPPSPHEWEAMVMVVREFL